MDKFFTDYNAIAEVPIPADEIEKGNIRTKALVYIDDLSLERPGVKFCVSVFRQKSRMALESRADSGLNPLLTESHGGQNGMRAGTA